MKPLVKFGRYPKKLCFALLHCCRPYHQLMGNLIWKGVRAGIASEDLFVVGDNSHLPVNAGDATRGWVGL